ncbi:MAG: hypothetical protein VXV74_04995, partial [Pseudomonadota bacterium]|nr:hypothetical protein [Pseudomonadota bacterium]
KYRDTTNAILEMGVQNCGSLEIWSKYFYKSQMIIGNDILDELLKIKFEDTELCKASCMGEKRKYKKTPFNSPATHQFRSPEIAKNVVITNAEMDPIKSNIDGQAMTGTFDKPIIVASAFFDILNLLSPQERDESRTFCSLHLLQLLQKLRRSKI